jgi:DNA-binding phage protein
MCNYIKATFGFPELAEPTQPPKNGLMRMFSPKGNPSSRNMFGVIAELAKAEGVNLSLRAKPSA